MFNYKECKRSIETYLDHYSSFKRIHVWLYFVLLVSSISVNMASVVEVDNITSFLKNEVPLLNKSIDKFGDMSEENYYLKLVNGLQQRQLSVLTKEVGIYKKEAKYFERAYSEALGTLTNMNLPPKFLPRITLSPSQEELCLSILLYGEERMGSEIDMIKIANTVYNRVDNKRYPRNACLVAKQGYGKQFSSMVPYTKTISNIAWGKTTDFTPKLAKSNSLELNKWNEIRSLAKSIIAGERLYYTRATHFVALKELKTIPEFVRAFRPVGITSGHVLFVDHDNINGKLVRYTKENPYRQAMFNASTDRIIDYIPVVN